MSNVYLRMHNFMRMKELMNVMEACKELQIVGISSDGILDLAYLKKQSVDILIIEFDEKRQGFKQFIKCYENTKELHDMQIIPLFKELTTEEISLLLFYGIHDFLIEPISPQMILSSLRKVSQSAKWKQEHSFSLDSFARKVLLELGLPMHLYGFEYIKTCAQCLLQETNSLHVRMLDVYDECAKQHATTTSRVEKCIRTAINYAYRRQPEKICIYNDKPTSSQIILFVSERLRLYHMM